MGVAVAAAVGSGDRSAVVLVVVVQAVVATVAMVVVSAVAMVVLITRWLFPRRS